MEAPKPVSSHAQTIKFADGTNVNVRRSIAWQCLFSAVYDARYTYVKHVCNQRHRKTNVWGSRTEKFAWGQGRKSVSLQ